MKSKIFSTDQVRGIQEGRITQFMQEVKQNIEHQFDCFPVGDERHDKLSPSWSELGLKEGVLYCGNCGHLALNNIKCPFGKPEDIIYVRETWAVTCGGKYEYKADGEYPPRIIHEMANEGGGEDIVTERWFPSARMPRAAARLFLKITNVRVMRVQELSAADVFKQGIDNGKSNHTMGIQYTNMQRIAFIEKHPEVWQANRWQWVVSFEKINKLQ